MVEFAYALPFLVGATMVSAELVNFTTTKMRVSQLALQVADNASRIGTGTLLSDKQITELQINDLLTGAQMQSGKLDIFNHGRIIISSLQPVANPNPTDRYLIRWQRCRGTKAVTSSYGVQGDTNLTGINANNQLIKATENGAVMFVQISYTYQPLIGMAFVKNTQITDVAAMTVRDNRDYTTGVNNPVGIYNPGNAATPNTCDRFTNF